MPRIAKRRDVRKSVADDKSNVLTVTPQHTTTQSRTPTLLIDDDFPDPFTDVSEKEADADSRRQRQTIKKVKPALKKKVKPAPKNTVKLGTNPFTGLKLTDERPKARPRKKLMLDLSSDTLNHTDPVKRAPAVAPKPSMADVADTSDSHEIRQAKLQRIASRRDMSGLKGFCSVALRDVRELFDTKPAFSSTFELKTYLFSSSEAKTKFDVDPNKYAPMHGGADVVLLMDAAESVEGSLDHAVWFKDRLYLFSSAESLATFNRSPVKFTAGK